MTRVENKAKLCATSARLWLVEGDSVKQMPLRAHLNGKDIFSFDFDTDSWVEFKKRSKHLELSMPCCNATAVPKTSKLGNFFFSHKGKGNCVSEAESQEHLFIKSVIAQAAIKAGWETTTEKGGKTPNGEQWVADVYCTKGEAKVVFEVQLSKQTKDETLRRQDKYIQSGVRCAWIVSEKAFADSLISNKETPFFRITKPRVSVVPKVKVFDAVLPEFIEGMLEGQLKWQAKSWKYGIYYVDDVCWKCSKENKQICGYTVNWYINRAMTVSSTSTLLKGILDRIISNNELIKLGLNTIAATNSFNSKVQDLTYYCNHCLHCGAAQSNEHLIKKIGLCIDKNEVGGLEVIGYTSAKQQLGSWVFNK